MSTIPASSLCHIAGPRGPVLTCDTIVDDYLATVPLSTRRLHASGLGRALRVLHPGATHLTWRDVMVAATRLDAALHTRTDSPCLRIRDVVAEVVLMGVDVVVATRCQPGLSALEYCDEAQVVGVGAAAAEALPDGSANLIVGGWLGPMDRGNTHTLAYREA